MAPMCYFRSISNSSKQAIVVLIALLLVRVCCDDHRREKVGNNCLETERRALLAIKSDMYDSADWLSSWIGHDCCKWRGVACESSNGHVTSLDLHYPYEYDPLEEIIGVSKVNTFLAELKYLKYLDLSLNNFSAPVPNMIVSLVHLEYLNLSNALFIGSVPPQLGNLSQLHSLDLGCCNSYSVLSSDDLSWLSHITSLKYLDMSCVNLYRASSWLHQINLVPTLQVLLLKSAMLPPVPSPLPAFNLTSIVVFDLFQYEWNISDSMMRWLSNASNLEQLDLSRRGLGTLDFMGLQVALGALHNLRKLVLFDNKLQGEISIIMKNVSKMLQHLDLSWNSLSGEISTMFWSLPRQLEFLSLEMNDIYGRFPQMLGNCTRLRHLSMRNTQITGDIPRKVGELVHLEYLDLSQNHITGEIPLNLGNLTNLVVLYLRGNDINGSIPESFGNFVHLEELDISENNISGEIPKSFGELQNLLVLDLHANSINGQIPKMIGRIPTLWYLDASENHLIGEIPKTFGGLCNISTLHLSINDLNGELTDLLDGLSNCPQGAMLSSLLIADNELSGVIPLNFGLLAHLEELDLSSNSMQGNITEAHFSRLMNLMHLNISFNSLNVALPNDWHASFSAYIIDMSFCHLGGMFPSWIRSQTHLDTLYLSGVGLSGTIPLWFSNFISEVSLQNLDLSSNNLNGPLPSTLSPFTDLSNNLFEGPIPLTLANANYLQILTLSNNHIDGSFPAFLCNLTSLIVIDLSNNYLSGRLPQCKSVFLFFLQSLHLNNNSISGRFPSFLKTCDRLLTLDLSENKFSGEIPTWVGEHLQSLKFISLRSNFFTGIIPENIGHLTSLQVLDLSFNSLCGRIPPSVGNFSSMFAKRNYTYSNACNSNTIQCMNSGHPLSPKKMNSSRYSPNDKMIINAKGLTIEYTKILALVTSIDLSHNKLSGEIPKEMMNLLGLQFLSLSDNRLNGTIPEIIGVLTELESLDLSMNNFIGVIPSTLSVLDFLSHLNLSYNNLSGRIPTGNQFSTFNDPSIYVGNKDLCGVPLSECPCDEACHQSLTPQVADEDREKLETLLKFVFIVMGFIVGFWAYFAIIILKKSIRDTLFQMMDKIYDWICVKLSLKFAQLKSKWQK
ncbi:receptor-like protein 12 [Zingiber officinale]|uniref:Uncharacterized protein n=1 Tax=Zingiber officinale TaxID=94328 RepID=A0A8J5GXT5_ZINOF|nr:receptor-like protein 12 [Zingiber officinale]KAG6511449.1 hypothetical protein ZIOFF_029517 [Zingiber officinale]